jgi:hypothetical protein
MIEPQTERSGRIRKLSFKIWCCLWVVLLLCLLVPMRYTALKVGLVASSIGVLGLTLHLFWARPLVRAAGVAVAFVAVAFSVFLLLPGRPYDKSALRTEYVRSLLAYQGTPYVWGGGNRLGIDCSGLVERALVDAYLKRAAITVNPALAREAVSLWWHNRSAKALGEGYRDDTRLLREVRDLNTADYNQIEPGDLAVLSDGVHVLAYIGSRTWIEADPISMRTITAAVPRTTDIYFSMRVRLMKWRTLE